MDDNKYNYKVPSKAGAWALLIIASIIALVSVYFWLPVYRACQAANHNVLEVIKSSTKAFALYAGLFAVFFIISVISNIKFNRCRRYWGPGFGIFLGRLIILLEYAAFAVSIVALFIG